MRLCVGHATPDGRRMEFREMARELSLLANRLDGNAFALRYLREVLAVLRRRA